MAPKREGIDSPPISTINKVLKHNSLVKERERYEPKEANYPALTADHSNFIHQFDVVGPRYLKTDDRFYSATIDTYGCINPVRRQIKTDINLSL